MLAWVTQQAEAESHAICLYETRFWRATWATRTIVHFEKVKSPGASPTISENRMNLKFSIYWHSAGIFYS